MDVPLEILDREVARAAADLERARALLARGEPAGARNPLAAHRRVSSRDTCLELAEAKGPLAAPLLAWTSVLTLERVLWADTARLGSAWHAATIPVEGAGVVPFLGSPRDLLLRILRDADPTRRHFFAETLARGAAPVTDAARILVERRSEAARLLSADLDALEIPVEPRTALATIAERVLSETAPFFEQEAETWDGALAAGLGRSLDQGWPARLRARWLFELFHGGPLDEGLRLDLGPLPESLGASSFVRALAAFGGALADADGPRTFFVLGRPPFDLRRARRAALFAGLAADTLFGMRALGLGRDRARDQARGVARALLVTVRLDAARVLLRGVVGRPNAGVNFEERTAEALGTPLPRALAGVVPRLGPSDPTRLAGVLLAAADRRSLVDRFDEDWFRSPHAALAIRDEDASVPASPRVPAAALESGLAELVRVLGDLG